MQRILFSLLLILGSLVSLSAQENSDSLKTKDKEKVELSKKKKEKENKTYFKTHDFGVFINTVKDQGASPLTYSGPSILLGSGFVFHNSKVYSSINLMGGFGVVFPKVFPEEANIFAGAFRLGFEYKYLFRSFKSIENVQLFIGPSINTFFNMRAHAMYSNSIMNYEGVSALNVSSLLKWHFGKKKRMSLNYALSYPIGSFVVRPEYTLPFYIKPKILSGLKFPLIDSRFNLNFHLLNGNILSLSYDWLYFQIMEPNKVQNGSGILKISTLFKL